MKCQLIVSHGEYHVCHQNDTYRVLRAIWVKMNLRNSKDPYWERKKPILFQGNGVTTVFLFQILHVYNLYNIFRMIGEDLICIYQTFKMKIKRDKQGLKEAMYRYKITVNLSNGQPFGNIYDQCQTQSYYLLNQIMKREKKIMQTILLCQTQQLTIIKIKFRYFLSIGFQVTYS